MQPLRLILARPRSATRHQFRRPPRRMHSPYEGFGRGKRPFEHSGICRDPEEGPEGKPSEANEVRPREHSFEPGAALLVLLRSRAIGMK